MLQIEQLRLNPKIEYFVLIPLFGDGQKHPPKKILQKKPYLVYI
jgi:hypothetical protein